MDKEFLSLDHFLQKPKADDENSGQRTTQSMKQLGTKIEKMPNIKPTYQAQKRSKQQELIELK
jgi:hypothetical protein